MTVVAEAGAGRRGRDVFSALGDRTRRDLLERLASEGEKTVTELMAPYAMSQPAVSKHLRRLREAGLVRRRAVGRRGFYTIDASGVRALHEWISQFERYWDEKLDALGNYLDRRKANPTTEDPKDAETET